MSKRLVLFLCLVTALCVKKVTIAETVRMGDLARKERENYVRFSDVDSFCIYDSTMNHLSCSVPRLPPDMNKVKSLVATWYGKTKAGLRVDPHTLELKKRGWIYITANCTVDQLVDAYGCKDLPYDTCYIGKSCLCTIEYFAAENGTVLMTENMEARIEICSETRSIPALFPAFVEPEYSCLSFGPIYEIHILLRMPVAPSSPIQASNTTTESA